MKITFPAIFSKITSRADKTFKVEFETRELGEQAAELMALLQTEGWCLFSPDDDITMTDIPDEKADAMTGQKTPSKRLMDRMFVYYTQGKGGSKDKFRTWYESELERIGSVYLEKLNG